MRADSEEELQDQHLLLPEILRARGLFRHHIDSYDYFVKQDMKQILLANQFVRSEADPNFYLRYLDVRVNRPNVQDQFISSAVTPMECRLRELTYSAPIVVDVEYTRGRHIVRKNDVEIGRIPVMLKSCVCVLTGKNEEELAKMRECPNDPGGYFISNGAEKVVLIQEQLSKNRIILEYNKDSNVMASVTSSTHERRSKTNIYAKKNYIYLQHNSFIEDLPICIVLKGMGIETDQEAILLVGTENLQLFSLSIEEARSIGILTQYQALEYIGKRVRPSKFSGPKLEKKDLALDALANLVIAHVPVKDFNFHSKATYVCLMIRRVLEAIKDSSLIDDRDYLGNKRLELAGSLLSLMFEDLFKRFNFELRKIADSSLGKSNRATSFDIQRCFRTDTITKGFNVAISTGNWVIKRFKMDRAGVTQGVTRLSFISSLSTMTRISSQFEKTRKVSGPRSLQPSQWGMCCPADTPEGESCGLVKHLALLTHITTDNDDKVLSEVLYSLGVENLEILSCAEIFCQESFLVFLNGLILGIHKKPFTFIEKFRKLRRKGKISEFVSIYFHKQRRSVFISSDGGRVCRPLIIVENGKPRLNQEQIDQVASGKMNFDDLIKQGCIEYIDVNEENDSLIALKYDQITEKHTHLEIDPLAILGVAAGLIPYPHHNQSPRNTYQSVMGKQAMGAIAYNQFHRIETVLYLLCYPQKPLVKTRTIEMVGFENLPAGHNATVCVMSYSGYDIEDAIILNKASLDRGFGRCMINKKYSVVVKKYPNGSFDRILAPPSDTSKGKNKIFKGLDSDGIVHVGEIIESGDVLVNKQMPLNSAEQELVNLSNSSSTESVAKTTQYVNAALKFKGPCVSVVDQVILTSNESNQMLVKANIRSTRRPEIGDKFSSRHGQKGVCGLIANQEDLPFSDNGICPDIIMNPHGFPSRMTVGKMIELLSGKAGVLTGEFKYGTAFSGDPVNEVGDILVEHGFSFTGKECLTSGITGEQMTAYVYSGPIYYQKLKHMVMDKIHARSTGPRSALTRQPTEGRAREGGLRLGEMERDCLIGYGASMLIQERLMLSSDVYTAYVCQTCGFMGYENAQGKLWCSYCKSCDNLVDMQIPYACKLLFQELISMSIAPRLRLTNM